LTGTAAAGENFQVPSIWHAQVLDVFQNLIQHGNLSGVLMHGRPPAGPAIAISFLLVAIACSFAGLCYAELASMIPIAGSAYTYSYATLGELIAWIIGWDLILEYAVSNVAVAIGFGGYLKAQLTAFGLHIPDRWSSPVIDNGLTGSYFNVPAFLVVFVLTVLLVWGIRESAEANNIMVVVKIGAILTFLIIGGTLVNPANWHPFAPSGFAGVIAGGAIIFFTYIGFDSVSTAAEEARNPQRDMPIGIIASLVVCTVLYISVALVLLGMERYGVFGSNPDAVNAPVAYALRHLGASRVFQSVIIIGALMGMISSLLVFQYGQTRIWFAMSRDGLLPKLFSAVHPRFKTPHWSTWIAGAVVGVPAGLFSISEAADLSNIGTLFAFVLVSLGVLFLRRAQPDRPRAFKVPWVPWFPIISVLLCLALMAGLLVITWARFVGWLILGLIIYFLYSRRHSEFASGGAATGKS
jgi:APA family basic amino acid/polyamine antiporter